MQASKEMKSVISQIGDKHGYKWWAAEPGTILKAELEFVDTIYYPLVIEKLTETTLRVAHEITTESGEIICNPEIIFFIGYPEWIAMELQQPFSLITSIGLPDTSIKTVELTSSGRAIKNYEPVAQKNITIVGKAWAKQLKAANWAKLSTDAEFHQGRFNEKGEVEEIIREMDRDLRRSGNSMTVMSGGRSATIGQPQP